MLLYFDVMGLAEHSCGVTVFSQFDFDFLGWPKYLMCFGGKNTRLAMENISHHHLVSWSPVQLFSDVFESCNWLCSHWLDLICAIKQSTGCCQNLLCKA